ncbi:hypothetical protein SDC9_132743 [bioreactor metagenome]|uniref:Uncharacterized protein n=1 Tax=bioreactor metagenome TaxID=1076179 RepID=A0A645DAN5_9ZZZZ
MGRIGDEDTGAFCVTARVMVSTDDHDAHQFTLGAGSWFQTDSGETTDLFKEFLQVEHQRQVALNGFDRL